MLDTRERISDEDLAVKARELAELLNGLPLPPLRPTAKTRPLDLPDTGGRVGIRATG